MLVLITGAAGGLGRQLALHWAREGAVVALWDVRAAALDAVCDWLSRENGVPAASLHPRCVDVADARAVSRAAESQLRALGPVRVLVNNAAIVHGHRLLAATDADLQRAIEVNVLGHFWTVRAFMPQLASHSEGGSVVTISSLMASVPCAGLADYCASKAAVCQLHECLRCEIRLRAAPPRVHCLLVLPYLLDTPLFDGGESMRWQWLQWLFPAIEPARVARRVVHAVRTRQQMLVLPWVFAWLPLLLLLPLWLRDALLRLFTSHAAMENFRGRGRAEWDLMRPASAHRRAPD